MPLFKYKAVDLEGRAVEGTMDEPSARRVTEMLQEHGLQVNSVKEVGRRLGLLQRLRPHLNWEDIDLLNEQLAAITRSGLPVAPSLKASSNPAARSRPRSAVIPRVSHRSTGACCGPANEPATCRAS